MTSVVYPKDAESDEHDKNKGRAAAVLRPFKFGAGLVHDAVSRTVRCSLAGALIYNESTRTYYVLSNRRRYLPSNNDRVVGIVEERYGGDSYRVNLFGPRPATLSMLDFEGATKRNRPHLDPGTAVYCRVSDASPHRDGPSVTCLVGPDGAARRRDWMTEEGTYGQLRGGTILRVSLGLARELLRPDATVLRALGRAMPFEVAVGVNGVVWVHSGSDATTVIACNAIRNSEIMTDAQVEAMVKELLKRVDLSSVANSTNKTANR